MPSDAYNEAIDRAALMLLAALRDHAKPHYSSVQLEAMRLRGGLIEGSFGQKSVHAVFADIRRRATSMLAAELRTLNSRRHWWSISQLTLNRLLTSTKRSTGAK